MNRYLLLASACLALALPAMASATITASFGNRAAFAAAIGHIAGNPLALPGAPPVFAASLVTGPITLSALADQLAGDGGAIVSTALDSDVLILDFAQPVFAVGVFGGIGDLDFAFIDGVTDIELVGSGTASFANGAAAAYFGLVSDIAFSQVRLSVNSFDGGASSVGFVGLQDRIDLATDVPEPASWGLLTIGFAALGAVARRRRSATRARAA